MILLKHMDSSSIAGIFSKAPFFQLRLDARNAFDHANYQFSMIYIIIALESVVKMLLNRYYDEDKMKQVEKSPLSDLITKHLNKIIRYDGLTISINDIKEALKIRNKVFHEGYVDIKPEDAKRVYNNVDEFIKFLINKLARELVPTHHKAT